MNPEEETIGDLRVRYFVNEKLANKEKVLVSIFGRQSGNTIDYQDPLFLMSLEGESLI